jgi:hypothetical protein
LSCELRTRPTRSDLGSCGDLETAGLQAIEIIDDTLVQAAELTPLGVLHAAIAVEGAAGVPSTVTTATGEGNQISRMTHSLIQRLGASTEPRAW